MERGIRILNFVSFWCVHVGKDRTDFLLGIYSEFGIYKSEFESIILLPSCRFAKQVLKLRNKRSAGLGMGDSLLGGDWCSIDCGHHVHGINS